MSRYGLERDQISKWVEVRAAELDRKWAKGIQAVIPGSPYSCEAVALIDDATNRQARAERLAYMRGEPIAQCLNGGHVWLEVECNRCKTRASLPLDAVRRPRDTPIEAGGLTKVPGMSEGSPCAAGEDSQTNREA